MQIELGAHVHTQDDRDAGVIKPLILDPHSEQVKTVVIEKGLLLPDDVEVPLSALQGLAPNEIRHDGLFAWWFKARYNTSSESLNRVRFLIPAIRLMTRPPAR